MSVQAGEGLDFQEPDKAPEPVTTSAEAFTESLIDGFQSGLRFRLDPFQLHACRGLAQGRSVLVAAPTGAGKTIVAEFAVHLTMLQPRGKIYYTAPMKALSNQKYNELLSVYGASEVGLLTGDTNINSQARIVVMTTEVLRNMIYAGSELLDGLQYVVMDEVHYLADRFRGAVWEEVIIHLPETVRLVALSATVSNAEEFGDWLQTVRGDTEVIVSEERPVPLHQHVLVRGALLNLFDEAQPGRVNPELLRLGSRGGPVQHRGRGRGRGHAYRQQPERRIDRGELIELLWERELLPAIFFIFSRAGCEQAVRGARLAGLRLTTAEERVLIRQIVEERTAGLPDEDLAVLGYWEWLEGLERGLAAHHAGMLPAFKEVVEELFQRKLVKVVFATETLALGINMPARTVVLEKLEKFNGEARVPITAGEYTQLTGRAGRRGIDVEGHSVIVWHNALEPQSVASLASRRSYPMNSSFRPSYNMAVNLIDQFGVERTRELLESSFAQFQADRSVVDLARKVQQQERTLSGYAEAMRDDDGVDFAQYTALRREIAELEKRNRTSRGAAQQRIQTALGKKRQELRAHPAHSADDREQRSRWAERWWRLRSDTDGLLKEIQSRTGTVARIFDRVSEVLLVTGHLVEQQGAIRTSAEGQALKRIYGERDLLVAEALRQELWSGLDAPSMAAMACVMTYEPRRDDGMLGEYRLPRGAFQDAYAATMQLWNDLDELERHHRLPGSEPPSPALATAMHRWARGAALDLVLRDADLAAGDFVRWVKQAIDLLDQLSLVAPSPVAATARAALDAVRRGIVAYSSVL